MKLNSHLISKLCSKGIGPNDPRFAAAIQTITEETELEKHRSQKQRWTQGSKPTHRWLGQEAHKLAKSLKLRRMPTQSLASFACASDPRKEVWVLDEHTDNETCELRPKQNQT